MPFSPYDYSHHIGSEYIDRHGYRYSIRRSRIMGFCPFHPQSIGRESVY